MKLAAAVAFAIVALTSASSIAQVGDDAEQLAECVNRKAGPEGDLPPPGPLREQIMAEMTGGPQACIGLIYEPCMKKTNNARVCNRREMQAWMEAVRLSDEERRRFARRNVEVYKGAVNRIRGQARALCHAAAAVSAWGSEAVTRGTYGRGDYDTSGCEREAVAQQALIIMVTSRGN
ncbi:MAG: hypothetical protein ACK4MV_00405 [Beijerinckiaceae bacterium]